MVDTSNEDIFIGRSGYWQINKFIFVVKLQNNSENVITHINVTLDRYPSALKFLESSITKNLHVLQPNGAIWSPRFELDAGNECVSGKVYASVKYFDHKGNPQLIQVNPVEIAYICPLLEAKKIEELDYLRKTRTMTTAEERISLDESFDLPETLNYLKKKMEEMNLAIVDLQGKPNEIVGYAEDKIQHDGLALEATIETIKNSNELILKVLCEHDDKCHPLLHKAVQEISDLGLSIEKSIIIQKLNLFLDKPEALPKYLKRVIETDWSEEKKDQWASVVRDILEDWIKFNPNKWKKIAKILMSTLGSLTVNPSLIGLISVGIKNLYEWIAAQYQKKQVGKTLKQTGDDLPKKARKELEVLRKQPERKDSEPASKKSKVTEINADSRGYIINSDSNWFEYFRHEANKDGWIIHFQISGRSPAKIIESGTYLFHRVKNTNKILGISIIEEVGYATLDHLIERYGAEKIGYRSKAELYDAAKRWTTSVSHTIFYEILTNLKLCNLDLNKDLIERFDIYFGDPPSHLPTTGKSLNQTQLVNLLDYLKNT